MTALPDKMGNHPTLGAGLSLYLGNPSDVLPPLDDDNVGTGGSRRNLSMRGRVPRRMDGTARGGGHRHRRSECVSPRSILRVDRAINGADARE